MPTCPICLEGLETPVSIPCGHVFCEECLTSHIKASKDMTTSACPSCRSSFHTVAPILTYVPTKFHKFMIAGVRRIFLEEEPNVGADSSSKADLEAQLNHCSTRLKSLESFNDTLREKLKKSEDAERRARAEVALTKNWLEHTRRALDMLQKQNVELEMSIRMNMMMIGGQFGGSVAPIDTTSLQMVNPSSIPFPSFGGSLAAGEANSFNPAQLLGVPSPGTFCEPSQTAAWFSPFNV